MWSDPYGVVGRRRGDRLRAPYERNGLGRPAGQGESPVRVGEVPGLAPCLSTPGHEESWRKQGGPPSKAEYSAATDSA